MPNAKILDVPRDVFCCFDNTDKLHAPANARRLLQMLDVRWAPSISGEEREPHTPR